MSSSQTRTSAFTFAAAALGLGLLAISASDARAALITYSYTGQVTGITQNPGLAVGDIISGSFSYDTTAADTAPSALDGNYDAVSGAGESLSYVGGFTVPKSFHRVTDGIGGFDQFRMAGTVNTLGSGGIFQLMLIELVDLTGTAFTSDATPLSLDFADFDEGFFQIAFRTAQETRNNVAVGNLLSLSVQVVPEPSAILLFAAGATLLGGVGHRRRNRP